MITLTEDISNDRLKTGLKIAGATALGAGLGHLYGLYDIGDQILTNKINISPSKLGFNVDEVKTLVRDPSQATSFEKIIIGKKLNDKVIDLNKEFEQNKLPERYYTSVDTLRNLGGLGALGAGAAYGLSNLSKNNKDDRR